MLSSLTRADRWSIRKPAIDGFNETLAGIQKAQEKFVDTQDHFVSLLTFCDCEKKYVFDKVPAKDARKLTMEDYEPCCCTPLYDAMGFTLTTMRNYVKKDLYGANQDSVEVAFNLSIRNSLTFETAGGTARVMARDTSTRMISFPWLAHFKEDAMVCCDAIRGAPCSLYGNGRRSV